MEGEVFFQVSRKIITGGKMTAAFNRALQCNPRSALVFSLSLSGSPFLLFSEPRARQHKIICYSTPRSSFKDWAGAWTMAGGWDDCSSMIAGDEFLLFVLQCSHFASATPNGYAERNGSEEDVNYPCDRRLKSD